MPVTDKMPLGQLNNHLPPHIQAINKILAEDYGKDLLGRPKFRLSHSALSVEKRLGIKAEMHGPIILREYLGSAEVPKYKYFNGYVLEQLVYLLNEELPDSDQGHYEPKWTDWGRDGVPNIKAARLIVRSILFGVKHTKSDFEAEAAAEDQASYDRFRAEIEDASTAGSGEQIGYGKILI